MLVTFSVSNFRSFNEERTFSMVASKRFTDHPDHARLIPKADESVLRAAAVYGPNAAGKSNLVKALSFLKEFVLGGRRRDSGTGRERFRLAATQETPTSFDLQYLADGRLYRYQLSLNDEEVTQESLAEVINCRERTVFERTTDDGIVDVRVEAADASPKLKALATVGGPAKRAFAQTIWGNLDQREFGEELLGLLQWLSAQRVMSFESDSFLRLMARSPELRAFVAGFLRDASTGVQSLNIRRERLGSAGDVARKTFRTVRPTHTAQEAEWIKSQEPSDAEAIVLEGTSVFEGLLSGALGQVIEADPDGQLHRLSLDLLHQSEELKAERFEVSDESDGTARLLELLPALHHAKSQPSVLMIDELDRSLHPMLARQFVETFLRECGGQPSQLIFTTHDTNLLDLDLLRRDEIWFAEKDPAGATHLYSLSDFQVRQDLDIRKNYLRGRFGAIPFLGGFDRLADRPADKP